MTTRRPGLSRYDQSRDTSPQARATRRYANKEPASWMPVMHSGGCWCGAAFGHDWQGKADGGPHPRDWPGRVNGQPYRMPGTGKEG